MQKLLTKFNINSQPSGYQRNIPQHKKSHIWQTHSCHHIQWQKAESIFYKIRTKTRTPTSAIFILNIGSPSHSNQTRKISKMNPNWKQRRQTFTVCRGHNVMYRKSGKHHQKKLLGLINKFNKVAGCKINIWKSFVSLH